MKIRRTFFARAAFVVTSLGAVAAANGCSSAPSEQAATSGEALVNVCGAQPFSIQSCWYDCPDPGTGGGTGGGGTGGHLLQAVAKCTKTCECDSLVGPGTVAGPKVAMSCYSSSGVLQTVGGGPAGCTLGVTLAWQDGRTDHNGALRANTWVCPIGTTVPANLGAAQTCSVEPYSTGTWAALPGASECEEIYTGTVLSSGTDCFGDPITGYELVQERVFSTTQTESVDAGKPTVNGACTLDCALPEDPQ